MKIKVLHVLRSQSFSGAENVAAGIITNLNNEYDLAYTSPQGQISATLKKRGIVFIPLKSFSFFSLKKVIKEWKPQILHSHDFTSTLMSVLVAGRIPIVAHIHQNPSWLKKISINSIIFTLSTFRVKKIIVVSPTILQDTKMISAYKHKINIIENIVDTNYVNKMSLVAEPNIMNFDAVFIGRLVDVKDPLRFIKIISQVVKKHQNVKAGIIGDGVLRSACERYIKELGLDNTVFLHGHVDNPFPILKNSKLLVMTSKTEGLPMTAIEALTLGKPIIVPDISSMSRLVDGKNGVVCENDDQFIAIDKILGDPNSYTQMSQDALIKAHNLFDMNKFRNEISNIYRQALNKNGANDRID